MNDLEPINVQRILEKHRIRPDKGFGQNFLIRHSTLKQITAIAEVGKQDIVLEIGSGIGNLTRFLAQDADRVIAVELDRKLIPVLHEVLEGCHNVEIIQGDILNIQIEELILPHIENKCFKVVANIPYNITSALIRHLLEHRTKPYLLVLTIQKEVAQRIIAQPGKMSLLSLSVQIYGEPSIAMTIPAEEFHPQPKVDSAVLKIEMKTKPDVDTDNLDLFFRLAKAGFSQKRKNLRNTISGGMRIDKQMTEKILERAGIESQLRAETLSINDWLEILSVYKELVVK